MNVRLSLAAACAAAVTSTLLVGAPAAEAAPNGSSHCVVKQGIRNCAAIGIYQGRQFGMGTVVDPADHIIRVDVALQGANCGTTKWRTGDVATRTGRGEVRVQTPTRTRGPAKWRTVLYVYVGRVRAEKSLRSYTVQSNVVSYC